MSDETMDARIRSEESQGSYEEEPAEQEEEVSHSSQAEAIDNNYASAAATTTHTSVSTLQSLAHLRDISDTAMSWQVSSAKPGNGVEQLRDPSTETYWQSDGIIQPHYIQVHFHRRMAITHVAFYVDYQYDESYTPKTVKVETGMTTQDLTCDPTKSCIELHEPSGWVILPILQAQHSIDNNDDDDEGGATTNAYTTYKSHLVRLFILGMHQNGRDTHVRRLALFAERQVESIPTTAFLRAANTNRIVPMNQKKEKNKDEDDLSYTRSLAAGFASLGMNSSFATTIR